MAKTLLALGKLLFLAIMMICMSTAFSSCSDDDEDGEANVDVRIASSVTVHIPKSVTICGQEIPLKTESKDVLTLYNHRNNAGQITIPRSRQKELKEVYARTFEENVASWIKIEPSEYSTSIEHFRVCTKVSPDKKRLLVVICKIDERVYEGILAYYQSFYSN